MEKESNVIAAEEIGSIFDQKNKPILDLLTEIRGKVRLEEIPAKDTAKEIKALVKTEEEVNLEESMIDKVEKFEIMGVPVIPVAGGFFVATVASELVDGLMSKQSVQVRGGTKLAIAAGAMYASTKWGKKIPILGSTGLKVMAVLMAFDGVRDLTPIKTWASSLANKISKVVPTGGLADQHPSNSAVNMANKIARDHLTPISGNYRNFMGGGR